MPRAEFTKPTKRDALKRSNGLCEASGRLYGLEDGQRCNIPLDKGVEFDHIVRACDGGDGSLENCAAVCPTCHSTKTRKFDTPEAAKTKRMSDKAKGISKPKGHIQSRNTLRSDKRPVSKPSLPPRRIYQETER